MMSLTFGLFTQVSGSGPLDPLVTSFSIAKSKKFQRKTYDWQVSVDNEQPTSELHLLMHSERHWSCRQQVRYAYIFTRKCRLSPYVTNIQTESIVGLRCRPRNPNPRVNGQYRKRGLPNFRHIPLTRGLEFFGLHRRPMFDYFSFL